MSNKGFFTLIIQQFCTSWDLLLAGLLTYLLMLYYVPDDDLFSFAIATEYSTTQSDDIITKAVNRTDVDDENIEEEGVVTGPVLAAAGVGLGMGIGTSLFALGVKNLIQKYKQGPSAPFRSGQVFVES